MWEIVGLSEKKDTYTLTVDNGQTIKVGKAKNGRRAIAIGNGKPVMCSQITTKTLPDYPTKDLTAFKDNGYRTGDTATVVGWLKDCPKEVLDKNNEFEVMTTSLFNPLNEINAYGKMDSLGRFTVKMPLENTQEVVFSDWQRTVLEPGETYFYLHDYKTGQQLMMGSNARVQNELMAHDIESKEFVRLDKDGMTAEEAIDHKNRWAVAYEHNNAHLDSVLTKYPTLSRCYEDYQRMDCLMDMSKNVMQAVFNTSSWKLPAEVVAYVDTQVWPNLPKPFTLSSDFGDFIRYYQYNAEQGSAKVQQQEPSSDTLRRLAKAGLMSLSQDEDDLLTRWDEAGVAYRSASPSDYAELDKKYDNDKKAVLALYAREDTKAAIATLDPLTAKTELADSLYADPQLRDVAKASLMCQYINQERTPLTDNQQALTATIQIPGVKQTVLSLNDKYLALQRRDISKMQSLKANDDVAGMSDGEQILRKITEPYRGRLVLLDVWGTWCAPCKAALANSKEEYERLKDYNLVYLYLANRSEDEAWKNVIKEYDLLGDDIVHYNLPAEQQSAVERFLNVHSFPSYRLIDRDGTVLDVNADPRNLERLAGVLEKLK